jgi:hypothetical protein
MLVRKIFPTGRTNADIVLDVQHHLEIVAPIAARMAVVGQYRIVKEDAQPIEIRPQPVENDDVRCNQQEIPRQRGIWFIEIGKRHRRLTCLKYQTLVQIKAGGLYARQEHVF